MSLLLHSAFSSDDMNVLRDALDCWCSERRLDIKSTEAQFAASAAIDLFQSGYTTSDKLLSALREHKTL